MFRFIVKFTIFILLFILILKICTRYEVENRYSFKLSQMTINDIDSIYFDETELWMRLDKKLKLKSIEIYEFNKKWKTTEKVEIKEKMVNLSEYTEKRIFIDYIRTENLKIEEEGKILIYKCDKDLFLELFGKNNEKYKIYEEPYVDEKFYLKLNFFDEKYNKKIEIYYILGVTFIGKGFNIWIPYI